MRRKAALSVFLLFAFFATGHLAAQKRITLKTAPQDFQDFYEGFKDAVLKQDRDRVVSMTRFPLVTRHAPYLQGESETKTREEFLSGFEQLAFADNLGGARLFSQANPVVFDLGEGTYCLINRIDTEFTHLVFRRSGSTYQLAEHVDFLNVRLNDALPEFRAFWTKFSNAILRRDREAVASMTRFPFKYGYDAGDEGTYTRAQFIRRFDLSGHDVFKQRNPWLLFDNGGYSIMSDEYAAHYNFEWDGKSYAFTFYLVEP